MPMYTSGIAIPRGTPRRCSILTRGFKINAPVLAPEENQHHDPGRTRQRPEREQGQGQDDELDPPGDDRPAVPGRRSASFPPAAVAADRPGRAWPPGASGRSVQAVGIGACVIVHAGGAGAWPGGARSPGKLKRMHLEV